MSALFDTVREIKQDVVRNIVNILSSRDAFSDLSDDDNDQGIVADKAIAQVMRQTNIDLTPQFHYSVAIGYPFETDHFMHSRYSDGTYPVWYGSLDGVTAIYETTYRCIQDVMTIVGVESIEMITRERQVYDVFCDGILIDLSHKKMNHPELVANDYSLTQQIGRQLNTQGYPGILSPSARHQDGLNVNIFKQNILSTARVSTELTYQIYPAQKRVEVLQKKKRVLEVTW